MISELKENSSAMEGKRLLLFGFLKPVIGGFFLYKEDGDAQREDFSEGVDVVVSHNTREPSPSEIGHGKCALIEGVFTAFDDDTVGTGYFRSTVGFIQANKITVQNCTSPGNKGD